LACSFNFFVIGWSLYWYKLMYKFLYLAGSCCINLSKVIVFTVSLLASCYSRCFRLCSYFL
jgi:hypothetical protein